MLAEQLGGRRRFARIDLSDLVDLQQTRPMVELVDGTTRQITWPVIEFVAGHAGRDVVIVHRARAVAALAVLIAELVDMAAAARRRGRVRARRHARRSSRTAGRSPVLATVTERPGREVGAMRTDYDGATGLQTGCSSRWARPASPPSGCGPRCRTTSPATRRRPRCVRCSAG